MEKRRNRPASGIIVKTDASCIIDGTAHPGIPTVVWPEGIDEVASDYLRYLVISTGAQSSSAYEYAKILRIFLRFCREKSRRWDSVDDQFLTVWREHMRRAKRNETQRINTSLLAVFGFYRWAEETSRIRFHVGIYDALDAPADSPPRKFPISATKYFVKSKRGRVYGGFTTRLTLRISRSSQGNKHTPTEEESRRIHALAMDRRHGERNTLMYSWAEETGLRRAEILRVRLSSLPTYDQIDELTEEDASWRIVLRRKRGGTWFVNVPADLIQRTLEWVEFGRREIVARCRAKFIAYQDPDFVFISSTTGMPLHPDSVTTLTRRDFAAAGVAKASLHRFRAKYCIDVIETLLDSIFDQHPLQELHSGWAETILVKAAEMMGHTSAISLKPYLNYVFNRKIRLADATKERKLNLDIRHLEQRRVQLMKEVDRLSELTKETSSSTKRTRTSRHGKPKAAKSSK
ncbi:hypothetical protein [Oryzibacter oryziterrae]|uniref:hypothetical protein n=1 Tax=Oryzibacter oryziterrae TaxID=2766474 RepID=UPI001F3D66CD|nr:hypothetical protein [Oryzibacter oryziterrae]